MATNSRKKTQSFELNVNIGQDETEKLMYNVVAENAIMLKKEKAKNSEIN